MKSFRMIMVMVAVLCCCGMVMGQDQPTQPDQPQFDQPQYAPQYVPQYAPQYVMPQAVSSPMPIWVIQKRFFFHNKYKAKPGWLNMGMTAAPMMVQAAPPVITEQVMVPQTVTEQVMVPETVMVPKTVTKQVMVPMQVQRAPKPVVTWTPQVQWRY